MAKSKARRSVIVAVVRLPLLLLSIVDPDEETSYICPKLKRGATFSLRLCNPHKETAHLNSKAYARAN